MNKDSETLRQIEALPEPRHLFTIPAWTDSDSLDGLIQGGYLTCMHEQRDEKGALVLVMGLQITPEGKRLAQPRLSIPKLVVRSSLAGASFAAMSLLILYIG